MKPKFVMDVKTGRYVEPGWTREDKVEAIRSVAGIVVIFVTVLMALFAF